MKKETPTIGTTCAALINENYENHLSDDCNAFCVCLITDKPCLGRVISDDQDQSSRFFSRARCGMDKEKLQKCPAYGVSKEMVVELIGLRQKALLREKLEKIK